MNNVQFGFANGRYLSFGTAQITTTNTTANSNGQFWVDLTSGYTALAITNSNAPAATGYSTATTTVTITVTSTTFSGGSILVYGVK
jgi:hypothetical protein